MRKEVIYPKDIYKLIDPQKLNLDPLNTYTAKKWEDGYRMETKDDEYIEFTKEFVENNPEMFAKLGKIIAIYPNPTRINNEDNKSE